ncbi:hypothetical protein [Marinimicrobium sp. ARAG 43.8]|uniref:hypothetical protein n=1 Tax=Marinimicrobium sp. ARAG 43.8 TaxID=3418719 RepID=UPI003CF3038E
MDDAPQLYLSDVGMTNAIGGSIPMVWTSVKSGFNRYKLSLCVDDNGFLLRLAPIPIAVFEYLNAAFNSALTAFNLLINTTAQNCLMYHSSDAGLRGALVVEKCARAKEISQGESL